MRLGRRSLLGAMTGVIVGAGVLLVPGSAGAAGQDVAAIDWQPCPDAEGVECATIEVPLDWSRPDGTTTHIGLAKRPAKDPDNRIGSILVDPGGPGGSGVGFVMSGDPFTEQVSAVRRRRVRPARDQPQRAAAVRRGAVGAGGRGAASHEPGRVRAADLAQQAPARQLPDEHGCARRPRGQPQHGARHGRDPGGAG